MTDKLKTYYEEHKGVFETNFGLVVENFDVEAIHKMRTSTKRLRSFFLLLEYLTDGKLKAKKQLKKIRALFKFSGRIREIQIEQLLVAGFEAVLNESYTEYLEYLRIREHREIARFLKHLPPAAKRENILNDALVISVLNELEKQDKKKLAAAFIATKENAIRGLAAKPASNSRIHSCRTHLKQLYYLFEILTELTGTTGIMGMTNLRIREIEQYFGDWHDLVNSPVYMNAFFKTRNFNNEKKYLVLKKKIAEKRKGMRKEILTTIYPVLIA